MNQTQTKTKSGKNNKLEGKKVKSAAKVLTVWNLKKKKFSIKI